MKFVPEDRLIVNMNVKLVDEKGRAISGKVLVYELTEKGPEKIYESYGYGITGFSVVVPRKIVSISDVNGKETKIYKSVNLQIVACNKDSRRMGVVTISIDPTKEPHPSAYKDVRITLTKVPEIKSEPEEGSWSKHTLTPVLMFAVWDGIQAKCDYPVGAKIKVESKFRPWGSMSWASSGSTEVTLDRGANSPYLSDRDQYTIKFDLKYIYAIVEIDMDDYSFYYETVYALDTNYDPQSYTRSKSSWNGNLPSGGQYYLTPAGDTTTIPVTSGSEYAFSVSVGFSYPYGVSVLLGVSKVSIPRATLKITSTGSSRYVKTVGFNGFLESYSNWV